MEFLLLLLVMVPSIVTGSYEVSEEDFAEPSFNSSYSNDMYVIHAMVYEVGIITNKTDNETDSIVGNQEAVTFFHSNGSNLDFGKIPTPILTNVTAQSFVGVMPNPSKEQTLELSNISSDWDIFQPTGEFLQKRGDIGAEQVNINTDRVTKRSNEFVGNDIVKIVKESAVIPEEAGVHSIAIPPLLAFNNNLSNIPVPIPNISVVHYTKINTLVHSPGE